MSTKERPYDHWVVLHDEDLGFILDGPDPGQTNEWVREVIGIIEDGLETW